MVNGNQENAPNLSPVRLMIVTAISIFVIEAITMLFIDSIDPQPKLTEMLIDSTLLVIFVSPVLYFFLFRPLLTTIKEREKMEKER